MITKITPDIAPIWEVPYTLYRYDRSDEDRYYFRFLDDERRAYLSMTSFVGHSLGIGEALFKWAAKNGEAFAKSYARYRADYGTQMHIEMVDIVRTGGGSFEDISRRQRQICKDLGYGTYVNEWDNEMRRDILAFLAFVKERNVKFVFAELPVYSDTYGIAGNIDFGAELDWRGTRVKALVDLKSGKKGFFPGHDLQLNGYKVLWNDLFKDKFEVTHVFNWAPNAWKPNRKDPSDWPTFKLKDQTNSTFAIKERMMISKIENWVKPPDNHMEIKGSFNLDEYFIEDHIVNYAIQLDEEE